MSERKHKDGLFSAVREAIAADPFRWHQLCNIDTERLSKGNGTPCPLGCGGEGKDRLYKAKSFDEDGAVVCRSEGNKVYDAFNALIACGKATDALDAAKQLAALYGLDTTNLKASPNVVSYAQRFAALEPIFNEHKTEIEMIVFGKSREDIESNPYMSKYKLPGIIEHVGRNQYPNESAGRKRDTLALNFLEPIITKADGTETPTKTETWTEFHARHKPFHVTDNADAEASEPVSVWQPFPLDTLPMNLRQFVQETADAKGIDPAFVAAFALSAISGIIGNLFVLCLKKGWNERPPLWVAVVALSGSGKTPALSAVLEPIRRLQKQFDADYKEHLKEYESDEKCFEKEYSIWKRNKTAADPPEKPAPPIPEQILIDDYTKEALTEILEQNPFGCILPPDELSGFFSCFDPYSNGEGRGLSFILSLFNGIPINCNRKTGRKRITADTPSVSIFGGIQPGMLRKTLAENPHYFDSGLAARFLFVMPEDKTVYWSDREVSDQAETAYELIFNRLFEMRKSGRFSPNEPVTVTLSLEAKKIWCDFCNDNAEKLIEVTDEAGRASFSKMTNYLARLALNLHVIESLELDNIDVPTELTADVMGRAVQLVGWFRYEGSRLLSMIRGRTVTADKEAARILAAIRRHGDEATTAQLKDSIREYHGNVTALRDKLKSMVTTGSLERHTSVSANGKIVEKYFVPSVPVPVDPQKHRKIAILRERERGAFFENHFSGELPIAAEPVETPLVEGVDYCDWTASPTVELEPLILSPMVKPPTVKLPRKPKSSKPTESTTKDSPQSKTLFDNGGQP